jgi:hypothetical protein
MAENDNKNGKKDLQVTPDDLSKFAKKIRSLIPQVNDAKSAMDLVDIIPGNFPDATNFRNLVGFGAAGQQSGRAGAYSKHLSELRVALDKFAGGLEEMVRNYTTTEDLNNNLAQKIGDLINSVEPLLPSNPAG